MTGPNELQLFRRPTGQWTSPARLDASKTATIALKEEESFERIKPVHWSYVIGHLSLIIVKTIDRLENH